MVWGSIKSLPLPFREDSSIVPPPKACFPLTMRSAGGSLRRASWWSLRRTALRSLGRYKISVPANWKRIVYMYTSIIIQHHPTSSIIIQHHPTSSSYHPIFGTIFNSGLLCSEAPNLHPSMGVATCEHHASHRQSLLLDTSFFRRWAKAAMFATRLWSKLQAAWGCIQWESKLPSGKLTWLWKITIFYGKTHYKWPFSIAMLNYQRVH